MKTDNGHTDSNGPENKTRREVVTSSASALAAGVGLLAIVPEPAEAGGEPLYSYTIPETNFAVQARVANNQSYDKTNVRKPPKRALTGNVELIDEITDHNTINLHISLWTTGAGRRKRYHAQVWETTMGFNRRVSASSRRRLSSQIGAVVRDFFNLAKRHFPDKQARKALGKMAARILVAAAMAVVNGS